MEKKRLSYIKYFLVAIISFFNLNFKLLDNSKYTVTTSILLFTILVIDIVDSRDGHKISDIALNLITTSLVFIGLIKDIKITLLALALFIFLTFYKTYKEEGVLSFKIEILKSLRALLPILIFIYHIYRTTPGPITLNFDSFLSYTLIILTIIGFTRKIKYLEANEYEDNKLL